MEYGRRLTDEKIVVESNQLNESKNQIVFQARQNSGDTGRRFLEDIDTVGCGSAKTELKV